MRRRIPLALLLGACLALTPLAAARSWTVVLGADAPTPGVGPTPAGGVTPRARVAVHDLRLGDDAFEFGIGWTDGGPAAAAGWRRTLAAGPLGTLVLDARTGVDAGGMGLAVAARGTLGPVALRLDAAAGNRAPGPWPVAARTPVTTPPAPDLAPLAGPGGGARLDLSANAVWRVDRQWTVDLTPRALRSADGWAVAAAGSLRRAAVAPDIDLSLRLDLASGPAGGHAAAGLTLHHAPRRAPESQLTAWWGGATATAGPGLELAWVVREGGAQATLAGAIGPRWADRPAAYLAAALQRPWGPGVAHVGARWVAPGAASLELAWVMTTDR
ncbi:MAG: hypothetical protein K0A98_15605 [Trueperaceae bacterium]|nr:hypothetical protein [Trueperaceae bacterium]